MCSTFTGRIGSTTIVMKPSTERLRSAAAHSRMNVTGSPGLDYFNQSALMRFQRKRMLRLRPEHLSAKLLISFHAYDSPQLPRLIVVLKRTSRENRHHPSPSLAN